MEWVFPLHRYRAPQPRDAARRALVKVSRSSASDWATSAAEWLMCRSARKATVTAASTSTACFSATYRQFHAQRRPESGRPIRAMMGGPASQFPTSPMPHSISALRRTIPGKVCARSAGLSNRRCRTATVASRSSPTFRRSETRQTAYVREGVEPALHRPAVAQRGIPTLYATTWTGTSNPR